jgi:hypothetical protein
MSTKSRQTIYGGPIRDADRAGRARPLRAGRARDQADGEARDHALQVGASGRGEVRTPEPVFIVCVLRSNQGERHGIG